MSTFLLVVVLPAGPDALFVDLDAGIYLAMAVSSVSVIGILMAGWSSANKYSLLVESVPQANSLPMNYL